MGEEKTSKYKCPEKENYKVIDKKCYYFNIKQQSESKVQSVNWLFALEVFYSCEKNLRQCNR